MTRIGNFIKNLPPFNQLEDSERHRIEEAIEVKPYQPGDLILREDGSHSKYLYLVHIGSVRLMHEGDTIDVLEVGELFGYPSLLNQTSPGRDVVAHEETELYCLPEANFWQLVNNNSNFADFFSQGLTQRLQRMSAMDTTSLGGSLTVDVISLITRPPVFVEAGATVGEAAKVMSDSRIGSAIIATDPPGMLTERDLKARVLAAGLGANIPVSHVMSQPLKTLPSDTPVYSAMLFMLQEGIHHLPLTHDNRIIGVVSVTDMLRHQTTSPFYLLRQLEKFESTDSLTKYSFEVARTVDTLYNGGLDVAQVGRMVASLNDALIKRLLILTEEELGPPPTPYTWLVFGSEGRMEQLLLTDQDNALIYQQDTPESQDYFAKLSEKVVQGLLQAGFPPCPGGYMATNWCKPLADWEQLFRGWIMKPEPKALMEAGIFFDFREVHGNLPIKSLKTILGEAKSQQLFLAHLARASLDFNPPLGFFKRIRTDDEGRVDLKKGGIAPIVGMARVYGLEAGVSSYSTIERLKGAVRAGNLSQDGADLLNETLRFLLRVRLDAQLNAYERGRTPDNRVRWDDLSPLTRSHLKEAFVAVRDYQDYVANHFNVGMLR